MRFVLDLQEQGQDIDLAQGKTTGGVTPLSALSLVWCFASTVSAAVCA